MIWQALTGRSNTKITSSDGSVTLRDNAMAVQKLVFLLFFGVVQ